MKFTCTIRGKILLSSFDGWIKKEDRVLDVGCGDGNIGKMIQEKYDCYLEGTDILDFLSVDIPFKKMINETKLPYDDKSFDIILLNDMLHHTRKQREVILESIRVAKKILIFETKPTIIAKILDHILNWGHNTKMPIPLTHRSSEQWIKLFEEMNLKYEYEKVKSESWYPISHFAFKLE